MSTQWAGLSIEVKQITRAWRAGSVPSSNFWMSSRELLSPISTHCWNKPPLSDHPPLQNSQVVSTWWLGSGASVINGYIHPTGHPGRWSLTINWKWKLSRKPHQDLGFLVKFPQVTKQTEIHQIFQGFNLRAQLCQTITKVRELRHR